MIEEHQLYSPNWWDHWFCMEIDFVQPSHFPRSGYHFERPFRAESFAHLMENFARDYGLNDPIALINLIRTKGAMRVRPGAL